MAKNNYEDTFTYRFVNEKFSADEKFVGDNLLYEVLAGSRLYGVNNDDSDYDVVGVYMDKHSDLYPQNYGLVFGFDDVEKRRVINVEYKGVGRRLTHKDQDLEGDWKSLVNFVALSALSGSPNLVEVLFAREQNIRYIHNAFTPIRNNATKFISLKTFLAFKGYAHAQYHRLRKDVERGTASNTTRQDLFIAHGYDTKQAYHVIRLIDLLDQMLSGVTDIDLMRNKEACKAMRRGEWGTWDDFSRFVTEKMNYLDMKSGDAKIPKAPRKDEIRNLLMESVSLWYEDTSLSHIRDCVSAEDIKAQLDRIEEMVRRNG